MSERQPLTDCTDERCPFVGFPHSVELIEGTDMRMHFAVDPVSMVITVLWGHADSEPWPDDAERARIQGVVRDGIQARPWFEGGAGQL